MKVWLLYTFAHNTNKIMILKNLIIIIEEIVISSPTSTLNLPNFSQCCQYLSEPETCNLSRRSPYAPDSIWPRQTLAEGHKSYHFGDVAWQSHFFILIELIKWLSRLHISWKSGEIGLSWQGWTPSGERQISPDFQWMRLVPNLSAKNQLFLLFGNSSNHPGNSFINQMGIYYWGLGQKYYKTYLYYTGVRLSLS